MSQVSGRCNKHPMGFASGCIRAGNDLTMPGMKADFDDMMNALDNKAAKYPITRSELQVTAKRVLNTVLRLSEYLEFDGKGYMVSER